MCAKLQSPNSFSYFLSYDWLKIYDGGTLNSPTIGGKLCGTTVPEQVISSTNELIVSFHSDDNDIYGGYRIKVENGRKQNGQLYRI